MIYNCQSVETVPSDKRVVSIIHGYRYLVPISRYMLHHLMQMYGEVAGLPVEKRKFHCLKHSIATHLLDAGADLAFVKDWLGHANIQNTTLYARLTMATLDSTARKVFASHRVV
jgi:site-specific recombinase XerD